MSAPRIRVLAVTNVYPTEELPGDTPCVRDQIEGLRREGVVVDLHRIDRATKLNYLRAAARIASLSFRPRRYDLIHTYYGHCGLLALSQVRLPVVATFLGSDVLSRRDGWIGRLVAPRVAGTIVMTEEMKRRLGTGNVHVIPFGINVETFAPRPAHAARRELGLHPLRKLVLFPWNPQRAVKRHDVVAQAVARLAHRGCDVEIVSIYSEPPERAALYMAACDVLVLASEHEGSPLAVREAMACNLPIVAVDVGDVRDVISGTAGCHIARRDPDDLADKLERVFERGMRTEGRRAVIEGDADRAARHVLDVYRSVLAQRSRHAATAVEV